jgi:hypothetical protein
MSVADGHPTDSMFTTYKKGTQLMNIYPISYKSKYERWYYSIIHNVKCQHRSKDGDTYYESHHIVPRSLGGSNHKQNLVLLTAREHFICHWLLYKFCEGKDKHKMAHAWFLMFTANKNQKRYAPSHIYEAAKLAKKNAKISLETRKKQSDAQKGKVLSDSIRSKISESMVGMKKSLCHKENLSKSLKGKKKSKEHIEKIAKIRKGTRWTEEQKQNLRNIRSNKGKNNPSFSGWYITPWGIFETPNIASDNAPFEITVNGIRKYCKSRNKILITNNHPIRLEYVGKTPEELGYGFKEGVTPA